MIIFLILLIQQRLHYLQNKNKQRGEPAVITTEMLPDTLLQVDGYSGHRSIYTLLTTVFITKVLL